jgi:hypothetical protein
LSSSIRGPPLFAVRGYSVPAVRGSPLYAVRLICVVVRLFLVDVRCPLVVFIIVVPWSRTCSSPATTTMCLSASVSKFGDDGASYSDTGGVSCTCFADSGDGGSPNFLKE